jgi:hypothetical protein
MNEFHRLSFAQRRSKQPPESTRYRQRAVPPGNCLGRIFFGWRSISRGKRRKCTHSAL